MSEYLPEWIQDLTVLVPVVDELRDFASNPFGYVWELIIEGILVMWTAVLGYVDQVFRVVAIEPMGALTNSFVSVIWVIGTSFAEIYVTTGSAITEMVAAAGVAAPIALVMGWAVPSLLTAFLVYFLIAIAETYLPVEPLTDALTGVLARGGQ